MIEGSLLGSVQRHLTGCGLADYIRQIRGRRIVFNAMAERRREYTVPLHVSLAKASETQGPPESE
jgi:hypothetical protein